MEKLNENKGHFREIGEQGHRIPPAGTGKKLSFKRIKTLIANRDGVALNELRWHSNAPLRLKITAEPAVLASRGKSGVLEAMDYRNEKVLAAFTHIPRMGWGFVAKQDRKEIYAPIGAMPRDILILLLCSTAFVYGIAHVMARKIAGPVIEMTGTLTRIREGDLDLKNREMESQAQ